jgi:glyoxylase-like metal-dependent hydrolase (beta-lactamase superfamily II)
MNRQDLIYDLPGFRVRAITNGTFKENSYLVHSESGERLLVDPGDEAGRIHLAIEESGGKLDAVLLTHAHFDHIGAVAEITERWKVRAHLHRRDGRLLRRSALYSIRFVKRVIEPPKDVDFFDDEVDLVIGHQRVGVIASPGHTEGGVCFGFKGFIFSGDSLFHGFLGPSNPPDGNPEILKKSVYNLLESLPKETVIFPGHGRPWTIAEAQDWWQKHRGDAPCFQIFPTKKPN